MVARLISLLDTYDMEIQHRRGSAHGNADALSRIPRRRCKREDCPQCKSSAPCTVTAVTSENRQDGPSDKVDVIESNWLEQWSNSELQILQQQDSNINTVIRFLQDSTVKPQIRTPDQELGTLLKQWNLLLIRSGLLYRKFYGNDGSLSFQLVAPREIRKEILQQLHNNRTASHLGREKTLNKVRSRFYWPGMTSDVARWCQTCVSCSKGKPGPGMGKSPMQHSTVRGPLECIAIDIMGPLPETDEGNQYIMVVGDYFSKWKEAYALKDHTDQTVADKLTCRFGTAARIHTDQGREFESELFSEICKLLGIEKSRTTPYRPQSDGMVERYNRTLQQMLAMYVDENRTDWDDHLPYIMMAYRASLHESTKCTPNLLMLGRETCLPIDIIAGKPPNSIDTECPVQYVEWVRDAIHRSFDFAYENLKSSFKRQKRYYDVKLKPRQYEKEQLVWCWYPSHAKQKLGLGWTGPYKIIRKISDITYQIESCRNAKLKIVHVDHLKPVEGNGMSNELSNLGPSLTSLFDTESQDEVHEVSEGSLTVENLDDETDFNNISVIDDVQTNKPSPKYSTRGRLLRPKVPFSP